MFPPYNTGSPRPLDIPRDTQDDHLNNFKSWNEVFGVDHIPFGNLITEATAANPCVLTVPDNWFKTGWTVEIRSLKGTNDNGVAEAWTVNTQTSTITVSGDSVTLDTVDASGENPYIANSGSVTVTNSMGVPFYGTHKKVTFQNIIPDPLLTAITPKSVLYTQDFLDTEGSGIFLRENLTHNVLTFLNNQVAPMRLTEQDFSFKTFTGLPFSTQRGFKTPFGFTINFGTGGVGPLVSINVQRTISLKVPYTTTHYFTLIIPTTLFLSSDDIKNGYILNPTRALDSFDFLPQSFSGSNGLQFYFLSMGV